MIRKLFAVAVFALGMLAFAPAAMADPPTNYCVLDLSAPAPDIAMVSPDQMGTCSMLPAAVASAVPSPGGEEDDAAGPCSIAALPNFDIAGHRQHEDPGRCPA